MTEIEKVTEAKRLISKIKLEKPELAAAEDAREIPRR